MSYTEKNVINNDLFDNEYENIEFIENDVNETDCNDAVIDPFEFVPVNAVGLKQDASVDLKINTEYTIEKECDEKQFQFFKQLVKQKRNRNPLNLSYPCSVCGKIMNDKFSLKNHYKLHFPEKCVGCKVCGKLFASESLCRVHEKLHSDDRPFNCAYCSYTTKTVSNLKVW